MKLLQVKVMHPTSLMMQLSEGCEDFFIKVEGRESSYTAKGEHNPATIMGGSRYLDSRSRQGELDELRLEQERKCIK